MVFGIMGDSNMQFLAGFAGREGGRFVPTVHEGGAVGMADGYARSSGAVGVASVTHGPGTTNTLTALTEAVRARSALLLMTADTPPVREDLQNAPLAAIATAAGADYWQVLAPEHVADDIAMAVAKVATTRVPLVLNIPAALLRQEVDYVEASDRGVAGTTIRPSESVVAAAAALIGAARRPLVVAGRGAVDSGARESLMQLADRLDAPVATTLLARDYFAGDEFDLGIFGGLSHSVAQEVIDRADAVIFFGAGLNPWTTQERSLLDGKTIVQVTTEPRSVGRYTPVDLAVIADAGEAARALLQALPRRERGSGLRTPDLAVRLRERDPRSDFDDVSDGETLDMRTAMIRADEILDRGRNVVTDSGRFKVAPWRYLHVDDPRGFTHTTNFGSIGLGLATALGVAFARPDIPTVCVAGDGGAMMNLTEFTTAVRERLPLVFIVLDDGSYGTEWTKLRDFGEDPAWSLMAWPDLADVATAFGGTGRTVRTLEELDAALALVPSLEGPLLIDVKADPTVDVGML